MRPHSSQPWVVVPRRAALAGLLVLLLAAAILATPPAAAAESTPAATAPGGNVPGAGVDWLRQARIGGLGLHETATDADLDQELDRLSAAGVTVVEADSSLSDYLPEADFDAEMAFVKRVVERAHGKGLKVVWYYPSVEVITPEGRTRPESVKRKHPEWLQRNFDRKTMNVFYGTLAFWVEPNDESAWMCPNSSYREFFYGRVERLAGTGVDGIWLDVPLFNSIVGKWPCADSHCIEKFQKETGLKFPGRVNLSDPTFRRWVQWRHQTLADFLQGAHAAGLKVNPGMRTVVEVVSCDHMINTLEGLDATYFDRGLDIVWEVDAISDTTSMIHASKDDWLTMMVVYKYCQGASADRSRWAFTYGFRDDDAQLVMAAALAAQCNPYETRIPQMVTSVGQAYRTRMFDWIKKNGDALFNARTASEVAVAYSPPTRDFVDGTRPGGFYVSPAPPSPAIRWWVLSPELSVLATRYLAEYRGWALMLVGGHVPFDIVTTNQLDAAALQRYRAVVVPAADALGDSERQTLLDYARGGGTLIVSGPLAGTMDGSGARRKTSAWSEWNHNGEHVEAALGAGRLVFWNATPGADYLKASNRTRRLEALALLDKAKVRAVVEGDSPVYVQAYEDDRARYLHVVHYGWVGKPPLKAQETTAHVKMPWSGGAVTKVTLSEPGRDPRVVPHAMQGDYVTFDVPVRINVLATVEGSK